MAIDKDLLDHELKRSLSECILAAELDEHLEAEDASGRANRRNGTSKRTVLTGTSQVTLDIPRDRASTFVDLLRFGGEALVQLAAILSNWAGLVKSSAEWRRTGL
jgi:transposase-like protein